MALGSDSCLGNDARVAEAVEDCDYYRVRRSPGWPLTAPWEAIRDQAKQPHIGEVLDGVLVKKSKLVSYDLRGVNAYRESTGEFGAGNCIQVSTNHKKLDVRDWDLATIRSAELGKVAVK